MLDSFFNPKSVAVVGASADPSKLGAVVLNNLISAQFKGKIYAINPKAAGQKLYGQDCYASVRDVPQPLDLVVIVVPAKFTMKAIDDCIANKTKNISIITAGFGEIGDHELEDSITGKCRAHGINLLGPNCLGHISTFTNLNASFADGYPDKGNVAFISQSGAYCSAMLDWAKGKKIGFSHFISIGNKAHLSETEFLEYISHDPNTTAFIFYLESLKHGQEFLKTAREVVKTKPIVVLEPGKSSKAQAASLSHTGSLAPNYRVLESAYFTSGIIQVYTTREMFGLLEVLQYAKHKEFDGQIAIVTNAGGVGVLTSDLCEDNGLDLAPPSEITIAKLKQALPSEAAFKNPIDVIGDAKPDRYEAAIKILCESKEYKNLLVLLTPQMVTDSLGTAKVIAEAVQKYPHVNIYAVFVGGERIAEAAKYCKERNVLFYRYPTDITRLLGLLKKQMHHKGKQEIKYTQKALPHEIKKEITHAVKEKLASLPQTTVTKIMDYFHIDYPKSGNFTVKEEALAFAKKFFPNPLVLKLSAPDALHKTEMKGIYLNVDNEAKFTQAWEELWISITKHDLKEASVLIQEMITKASEVIIGVNYDKTFGDVMLFGTGGIYTEVMKDTTVRVLPTEDFDQMIDETKIGKILRGVRGEKPRAVKQLVDTMSKIQDVIFAIPELKSIDINPILVTEQRACVVDFKMILKSTK